MTIPAADEILVLRARIADLESLLEGQAPPMVPDSVVALRRKQEEEESGLSTFLSDRALREDLSPRRWVVPMAEAREQGTVYRTDWSGWLVKMRLCLSNMSAWHNARVFHVTAGGVPLPSDLPIYDATHCGAAIAPHWVPVGGTVSWHVALPEGVRGEMVLDFVVRDPYLALRALEHMSATETRIEKEEG